MEDKTSLSGKPTYTVEEGRHALGVGRTNLYRQLKVGELESFKACGRPLIPVASLQIFVARARAGIGAANDSTAFRRGTR